MGLEYVDIGDVRVGFRRAGHGPVVVLVHGAVCDGRVWRRQLAELSDRFTVVAWDAPGCGASSDPDESFRLPDYADALAGLIAAVDAGPAHIVGHSFGGALALALASRHPDAVSSLILVGAYAGWAGSLEPDEVARRVRFAIDVAERLPGGFDPGTMPGLFTAAMTPEVAGELKGIMSDIRPVATRAMAYALAEADLQPSLAAIDVPVLLLYGDADERSPLDVATRLRDGLSRSQLVVLPGCGHYSFLEAPARFNSELDRFVSGMA